MVTQVRSRRLVILGSTGSIGRSTLDVVGALNGTVRVVGLAAGSGWEALARQAHDTGAEYVAIGDESHYDRLRAALPAATTALAGADGLVELVDRARDAADADYTLSAIVGAAGLPATLRAVERGMDIGLANKESLVIAGSILMPLARERGAALLPVDSEHSAIFQCLHSGTHAEVRRLFLTASGGPFRKWSAERIDAATVDEALAHPTWSMGPKITIDSATMMNKALEVVEARWLFDMPVERIEVLVHPESIVHSMVEFVDGSIVAQLGAPDMKTPIQYALTYPARVAGVATSLSWSAARSLNFEPADPQRFPALALGFDAARRGGTCGAVLNAANEVAVELFRAGKIRFGEIGRLTARVLGRHQSIESPTLKQLTAADQWARQELQGCRI
ncbi:MAG: 1-deoxy-D-xylulose-5-phosphate reductoisomerase [Planctomycetia bacterium]|nr:MAG: 1-deoxy-D-xylulose-5-phosphate reductoisomerase [Planctomycetia bacterium]